mmetsp:Transcript_10022/g.16640  ORF Transcript_10022/g.16640 Transcript_10022/m.16640 type:complete len:111 (-) Transcript_10022:56-388(-)
MLFSKSILQALVIMALYLSVISAQTTTQAPTPGRTVKRVRVAGCGDDYSLKSCHRGGGGEKFWQQEGGGDCAQICNPGTYDDKNWICTASKEVDASDRTFCTGRWVECCK